MSEQPMWLGIAFGIVQAAAVQQTTLPDPYTLAKDGRTAWVRRLRDIGSGADGRELYERANAERVAPDASYLQPYLQDASSWIRGNQHTLGLRFDCPDAYSTRIRTWVRLNDKAVALARLAADCPRAIDLPFEEKKASGRDWRTMYPSVCLDLAHLLASDVVVNAREERWSNAYADAIRLFRIAGHQRQQLSRYPGDEPLEKIGFTTLMGLLELHPPDDIEMIRRGVREAWDMAAPSDGVLWFIDGVNAAIGVENMYNWAETTPDDAPVRTYVSSIHDHRVRAYRNSREFRDALLTSSREAAYRASMAVTAFCESWRTRSPAALAANFNHASFEASSVAARHPYTRMGSSDLSGRLRPILEEAVRDTRRSGLLTVLAIHEWRKKFGRWPARLDELGETTPIIDPFSGRGFVYRLVDDGASFVLYSVGIDTVDDGGRAPPPRFYAIHAIDGIEADKGDIQLWPPELPAFKEPW